MSVPGVRRHDAVHAGMCPPEGESSGRARVVSVQARSQVARPLDLSTHPALDVETELVGVVASLRGNESHSGNRAPKGIRACL